MSKNWRQDQLGDVIAHELSDLMRTRLKDPRVGFARDRKSTRLNSSHPSISYAVFCLKKKIIKLRLSLCRHDSSDAVCSCMHCFFASSGARRDLHSFPTRRSSDLSDLRRPHAPEVMYVEELASGSARRCDRARAERSDAHALEGSAGRVRERSEEHTSELQSPVHLVCRLLLEKKNNQAPTQSLPA